jgi:hypothetical protein
MTIVAGSDFSARVLGSDPVRSTAGKLMTIPILLPQPLAAARCKSAAARFDSRKVNAPLTERSYPIFDPVLLQQSRSHDVERIAPRGLSTRLSSTTASARGRTIVSMYFPRFTREISVEAAPI